MARGGVKDLKDDEILRFLRFDVTESAAGTYTQQAYDTQLSINVGILWLIHTVDIDFNYGILDEPAAGAKESLQMQVTRESKPNMVPADNSDLITNYALNWIRSAAIGTEAGPMWITGTYPHRQWFAPPIAYAAQNIYISVKSTNAATTSVRGRIGFTLRKVTDKFFFRIAQALVS